MKSREEDIEQIKDKSHKGVEQLDDLKEWNR